MNAELDELWLLDAAAADIPSSSLDLIQTCRHFPTPLKAFKWFLPAGRFLHAPLPPSKPRTIPTASAEELQFRHAGYELQRERVAAALQCDPANDRRRLRLQNCGSEAIYVAEVGGTGIRVRSLCCGDRLCPRCNHTRGYRIAKNLEPFHNERMKRFVTLTRRTDQQSLAEALNEFRLAHNKLMRTEVWQRCVRSSVWFYEITRGSTGRRWHVHAHSICTGTWIDRKEFVKAWQRASGGSFVVDIEAIKDQRQATYYVTRYAAQILDDQVLKSKRLTKEAAITLHGIRLCGTTGEARGIQLCERKSDGKVWKMIAPVKKVVEDAANGLPYAVGLLKSSRREARREKGTIVVRPLNYSVDRDR